MTEFLAERVWDLLADRPIEHPIRAASAYLGADAPQILRLQHATNSW
ncbi:hypothetical protein [Cellulomonas sp. PSBB021]|nr:hypothetical protein [Cellulomonas sp. PSBB021]